MTLTDCFDAGVEACFSLARGMGTALVYLVSAVACLFLLPVLAVGCVVLTWQAWRRR